MLSLSGGQADESLLRLHRRLLPVHGQQHLLSLRPSGNPQPDPGFLPDVRLIVQLPVPGIIRFQREAGPLAVHRSVQILVNRDLFSLVLHRVFLQGGQQPGHVGRAAGAGIPFRPLGQVMLQPFLNAGNALHHLQGIDVEKPVRLQAHARQHGIVKRRLRRVPVFAVPLRQAHGPAEEAQRHRGAGFGISRVVGQLILPHEGLSVHRGSQAAGDVHLLVHRAVPQLPAGFRQRLIPGLGGHVGHAGIQIQRPHRVAHGLLLLPHGPIGLVIRQVHRILPAGPVVDPVPALPLFHKEVRLRSPLIQEIAAQLQVLLVSGFPIQAVQRQLRLRMPRIPVELPLLRADHRVDMIRHPLHDVQESPFPGGLMVGHRAFRQMPEGVQLVAVLQVGPALAGLLNGKPGVQVAVRLLGFSDDLNDLVDFPFQLRIRRDHQPVGRRLDPLAHVAVLEDHSVEFSLRQPRGNLKILQRVGRLRVRLLILQDGQLQRNHPIAHLSDLFAPESLAKLILHADLLFFIIFRRGGRD